MLGLDPSFHAKHARIYANVGDIIRDAVASYAEDVRSGAFPEDSHSFKMSADEEALLEQL